MNQTVNVAFNKDKMLVLISQDMYLKFVFNDLKKRGLMEVDALEIVFNSNVLGDADYEDIYQSI